MKNLITTHFIALIRELLQATEFHLDEVLSSQIECTVFDMFDKHGRKMSIFKIAKSLSKDDDVRIRELGAALLAA